LKASSEAINRDVSHPTSNKKCETNLNSKNVSQKGQKSQLMTESAGKFDSETKRKRQATVSGSKSQLLDELASDSDNYVKQLRTFLRSTSNTDDEQKRDSPARQSRSRSRRRCTQKNENLDEPDQNTIFKKPEVSRISIDFNQ